VELATAAAVAAVVLFNHLMATAQAAQAELQAVRSSLFTHDKLG
jgi:hypothetical protein